MCLPIIFCFEASATKVGEISLRNISISTISASISKSGQKLKCGSSCSIFTNDKVSIRLSLQRFIPDVGWRTIEYWISPYYKSGTYKFEKISTNNFQSYSSYRVVAGGSVYDSNNNFIESVVAYSPILLT